MYSAPMIHPVLSIMLSLVVLLCIACSCASGAVVAVVQAAVPGGTAVGDVNAADATQSLDRLVYVIAGLSMAVCLTLAAGGLLLFLKRSRNLPISVLIKLLCALLLALATANVIHALAHLWSADYVFVFLRIAVTVTTALIACLILAALPRALSFYGRHHLQKAEDELRESKQRFERALKGSSNGLWEWNIEAGEVWYAPRFRELLGYNAAEFPDRLESWENALHPDDRDATLAALDRHLKHGDVFDVEYRLRTKSGEYRWFHARGVAIRNPEGKPYLMAGSIQDIQCRKEAQESLREREEQMRHTQKLEAVGTLAGGVAHEFNNLIQVIQGYTWYAMDGLDKSDQRRNDLEQVLAATKRAAALTRQLLSFSRRHHGTFDIVRSDSLMHEVIKLVRPLIGEQVTMEVDVDRTTQAIRADACQIQQLVMNLCINARDAMPTGGTLTVATDFVQVDDDTREELMSLAPGQYLRLSVSDTGTGIPDEIKERIFEPFFTTKDVGEGTGLGLAMVFGIVQEHHGTITVDSRVGDGTTFRVYLPAAAESEPNMPVVAATSPRHGTETVLIAEDDVVARGLLARILERAGYSTLRAADGTEAVELFEQFQDDISVVVLDVMMPHMNGYDALKRIQQLKPEVAAILCTGYAPGTVLPIDISLQVRTSEIQKPFEPDSLLHSVRMAIDEELCASN